MIYIIVKTFSNCNVDNFLYQLRVLLTERRQKYLMYLIIISKITIHSLLTVEKKPC